MTEKSYLWTTGGAGDGASTYTRLDWAIISKVLAAVHGNEGVAPSLGNALSGTVPAPNTVQIGTGGAIVDGKPYYNDSTVDVTIPSAVGAGNKRIDRIVLRADWTAQTVRVTRIEGTNAASPAAPAVSQVTGSLYDVKLYQALVDTSGTVTLTDERVMGHVRASDLANDSVDDTKVGDRVLQVYRRQGGNAVNWNTPGFTTYTPSGVRMQAGTRNVVIPAGSSAYNEAFFFPVAFSAQPLVFVSPVPTGGITNKFALVSAVATSTSQAVIHAQRADGEGTGFDRTVTVHWMAIGPE